jgi:hypothetical protein
VEYIQIENFGRITALTKYGEEVIDKHLRGEDTLCIADMLADKTNFEFKSKDDLL